MLTDSRTPRRHDRGPCETSRRGAFRRRFVPGLPAGARLGLVVLALAGVASIAAAPHRQATAGHDWPRFGWDASRSSAPTVPSGITAADLSSLRRQRVQIGGTVDAAPIYLSGVRVGRSAHDVFFLTTIYGKTLAIDADDGTTLWEYTPPDYASWAGSYRVTNATPLADPDRRSIYAAAPDGRIRKLSVEDGHELWSTAITRLPEREKIASPLNAFGGRLVATTGGYIGDAPPYQGHVAILDPASGHLLHVWNSLCSDRAGLLDPASCEQSGSAIWGRAGAVIDTTNGHLFVATGDGRWDGRTYWGDAVLELDARATRLLGNFTPEDTRRLERRDIDLGSTSPVQLGGGYVAQGGKDGTIRLLDWSRMRGTSAHRGGPSQKVSTPSGARLFTAPAVWREADTTWMFVADNGGTEAWKLADGRLRSAWKNDHAGTSPVLSGGLLYVYDPGGGLRVYRARNGEPLTELECGGGHWNSPIVVDGRIAVPEGSANDHATRGVLDIWRLPGAP